MGIVLVDPYYLAQKAQEVGYHPEIILAGRRLNDSMGMYVANEVVKLMVKNDLKISGAKVLVLGVTFKEKLSGCAQYQSGRRHYPITRFWDASHGV